MLSKIEKALAWGRLGAKVFPVDGASKHPLTKNGHLNGTSVESEIRQFWTEFPDAEVGMWCGGSGLLVADLDRKKGKDGFAALEHAWLDLDPTFEYETKSNGAHKIYADPAPDEGTLARDYDGLEGFDLRRGSSYAVIWGDEIPESWDEFTNAPEWLLAHSKKRDIADAPFLEGLDAWLESLDASEPDARVLRLIESIPDDYGHQELIELQYNAVRLASESALGTRHAIDAIYESWHSWWKDDPMREAEYQVGLLGAIRKAGALDAKIAALPDYTASLTAVTGDDGISPDLVLGSPRDKAHYFKLIRALVPVTDDLDVIASVVWHAPTTKTVAREFGIDYLYDKINEERAAWDGQNSSHSENIVTAPSDTSRTQVSVSSDDLIRDATGDISLLNPSERQLVGDPDTFINRYLAWGRSNFARINEPHHRSCAWQVLAMAFGGMAFIPKSATDKLPVNLYTFNLSGSGTGKTESLKLQRELLRAMFRHDPGYNMGSNVSTEALHEALLARDGGQALFHTDEAARLFKAIGRRGGSYLDTLDDDLTLYYDGYIPPVKKKSAKDLDGMDARMALSVQFFGTPDWTMKYLDEDMLLSGFLARMQWTFGEDSQDSPDFSVRLEETASRQADIDPIAEALGGELMGIRARLDTRRPVLGSPDALQRLQEANATIYDALSTHPLWRLLEPSYRRLRDVLLKCSALHALSDGRTRFDVPDVLAALHQAEIWVAGLIRAVTMLAGSQFSREVEEIALYVRDNGPLNESKIANRFRKFDYRKEFVPRLEAAKARNLIRGLKNEKGFLVWEAVDSGQ